MEEPAESVVAQGVPVAAVVLELVAVVSRIGAGATASGVAADRTAGARRENDDDM